MLPMNNPARKQLIKINPPGHTIVITSHNAIMRSD